MPRELKLTAPRQVVLQTYEDAPLKPNEVRCEGILSGISHGTEMNLYRGTSPFADKEFDTELRLFVPRKGPAPAGDLGYEWVGRVTEVGGDVQHLKPGDLVHMLIAHRETHTFVPVNFPYRGRIDALPASVTPEQAIILALAGVALQAVHDAGVKVGDRVAIFGLGAIGLMAVQLTRRAGAGWIDAIDLYPTRRSLATRFGADRTFDPAACDVGYEIKTASPHRGADVAIELSGHYAALNEAIRCVRMAGTVVTGGFYTGGGTALRLGEEWHHNRVTMVSSMAWWECPHRDHPLWNRPRINQVVTDLLAEGKLNTDGIISHHFPFARAAEAYELIDRHPEDVVKVVLDY